ncbi:MAG: hypothetical protein R3A13_12755 [Bdellovibrionota bacterium]
MTNKIERARESGVILLIAGILFIPIFIFVAAFFIDTGIVKNANDKFSSKADGLCKTLVDESLNIDIALSVFRDRLNSEIANGSFGRIKVTSVKVVLPTMPEITGNAQHFNYSTGDTCTDNISYPPYVPPPLTYPISSDGVDFSAVVTDGNSCQLPDGDDCKYLPDFCPGGTFLPEVPAGFAFNLSGAGNVAACFFEAEVKTLFNAEKKLKFSTSWKRIVDTPDPGPYDPASPLQTTKSAFIGISSFFPAPVNDPRYRFNLPAGAGFLGLENFFDPLMPQPIPGPYGIPGNAIGLGAGNYGISAFINQSFPHPFPKNFEPPVWAAYQATLGNPAPPQNIFQVNGMTGTGTPNDHGAFYEQLMVSCANPISMARNIFLKTVVEMFSMHGDLRNNTTILHANPQPRNPATQNGVSEVVQQATVIRLRGEDLRDIATIPYLSYFDGFDQAAVGPPGAGSLAKWPAFGASIASNQQSTAEALLFPFDGTQAYGWSAVTNQHHTLVASLARFCTHMYTGVPATGTGIDSPLPYEQSSNLLPPTLYPQPAPPFNLHPGYPPIPAVNAPSWDPAQPWGTTANGRCSSNMQGNRCLTTGEVWLRFLHGANALVVNIFIQVPELEFQQLGAQ